MNIPKWLLGSIVFIFVFMIFLATQEGFKYEKNLINHVWVNYVSDLEQINK